MPFQHALPYQVRFWIALLRLQLCPVAELDGAFDFFFDTTERKAWQSKESRQGRLRLPQRRQLWCQRAACYCGCHYRQYWKHLCLWIQQLRYWPAFRRFEVHRHLKQQTLTLYSGHRMLSSMLDFVVGLGSPSKRSYQSQ